MSEPIELAAIWADIDRFIEDRRELFDGASLLRDEMLSLGLMIIIKGAAKKLQDMAIQGEFDNRDIALVSQMVSTTIILAVDDASAAVNQICGFTPKVSE